MAFRFLVSGDLHLGKRSSAVPEDTDSGASRATWERMVRWAIEHTVDAVLLTGDIMDRDNRYYEALGPLRNGLLRLEEANIPVYMVAGNHDHDLLASIAGHSQFQLVHLLGAGGHWESCILEKNGHTLQLIGWSFPQSHVEEDPLDSFNKHELQPNMPVIGMVHGELGSAESRYAPLNADRLLQTGPDVWALGHIHKPEIVHNAQPLVFYPGSLQALSPKEPNAHGPALLEVISANNITIKTIPLSTVRYETISVDVSGINHKDQLRNLVSQNLYQWARNNQNQIKQVIHLVFDLQLAGKHNNPEELRNWLTGISEEYQEVLDTPAATNMSVRKVIMEVEPDVSNLEELAKEPSPAGMLAQTILAVKSGKDTPLMEELMSQWKTKQHELAGAATYQHLSQSEEYQEVLFPDARKYILKECHRILAELIKQQQSQ